MNLIKSNTIVGFNCKNVVYRGVYVEKHEDGGHILKLTHINGENVPSNNVDEQSIYYGKLLSLV